MPPGKRRQSNAMLYTLMTFVGLFIIATTAAVVYYVRAEELRTRTEEAERQLSAVVSSEEMRTLDDIVGETMPGQSYVGALSERFDRIVGLATGTPVPTTSAEIKADNVAKAVREMTSNARPYISLPGHSADAPDPNAPPTALTTMMSSLLARLQQTIDQRQATQEQLRDLQNRFSDATELWQETEYELTAKVEDYHILVEQIKADYEDLRILVEQSSEDRVANLLNRLEEERAHATELNQELSRLEAELDMAQQRLGDAMAQISKIQPPPDKEAEAKAADGRVILVDNAARLVTINLGSDDRVYRGLTFSVYDNLGGIPRDGRPKAEIEVFAVDRRVSTARILSEQERNPIGTNDLVANLIWSSDKVNHFVIAGDFDLDGDGQPDLDARERIQGLIERWGGATDDNVSARTDFVILGTEPRVPPQPTFDDLTEDPMAQERYERARQRRERYDQIRAQANALYIPIFTYQRFLYFTGYESSAGKAGAF